MYIVLLRPVIRFDIKANTCLLFTSRFPTTKRKKATILNRNITVLLKTLNFFLALLIGFTVFWPHTLNCMRARLAIINDAVDKMVVFAFLFFFCLLPVIINMASTKLNDFVVRSR